MSLSSSNINPQLDNHQMQNLTEVLERISDGFFAVDRQWNITFINRILANRLSLQRSKYLNQDLWLSFPRLQNSQYEEKFRKAMKQGVTVRFEHYSKTYKRWFEITGYPSGTGLSVFIRDITERKATEEELMKLSMVAKETENAVIILNAEGIITWVNAAFTRMTGYTSDEAMGQIPSVLLQSAQSDPRSLHYINERQSKRLPISTEIRNLKKNGEPFWSEVSIQPIFDKDGNLQQFFSIRKDITERKKLEAELAEMQKKISSAVIHAQEKERAEVGRELHDNVNQVLTTVKLYTELCATGNVDSSVILPKCTALLNNTINEIRKLSKQLALPVIRELSLSESLTELVQSINDTRQLVLQMDISPIPETILEELQVATYRIAQEHFTNILKHSRASEVTVKLDIKDGHLCLQISDNGIGFDPKKKVSGIGIVNMKNRASMHNGILDIKSCKGKGCTLSLSFPL